MYHKLAALNVLNFSKNCPPCPCCTPLKTSLHICPTFAFLEWVHVFFFMLPQSKLSGAFGRKEEARSEGLSFSGSYKGLVPELQAIEKENPGLENTESSDNRLIYQYF